MALRPVAAALLAAVMFSTSAVAGETAPSLNADGATPAAVGYADTDEFAEPFDLIAAVEAIKAKTRKPSGHFEPGFFEGFTIPVISYTDALSKVRADEIEKVIVRDNKRMQVFLRGWDGREYRALVPGRKLDDAFFEKTQVRADEGDQVTLLIEGVPGILYVLIMMIVMFYIIVIARKFVRNPAKRMAPARKADRITFADVAGQDEAKRELSEVVDFLRDPKRFSALGARVPRGVLMEGDPGNGKTLLAKAVAGEAGVPFFHIAASEVLEMFAGLGARRIRQVFRECRKKAPCILFIDEIETIGGRRGTGNGSDVQNERDQTLNQLLVEMDGLEKRGNIVVIGATNRPDMLDSALLRPGRLDRRIAVQKPDQAGRASILAVHSRKVKLCEEVDLEEVARMTPGFSGAEIANLVNEAAIVAVRNNLQAVDMECFQAARDKALMGDERRSAAISDEERLVAAYHEAGHAIVALRSKHSDPVHKVTIVPRGRALGAVVRLPERDRLLISRAKLEADLAVAMGGRAAEEIVFGAGNVTTGAMSDIEHATLLAREMGGRWGMFEELGRVNYFGRASDGQGAASQATLARLDEVVRVKLEAAYEAARTIITDEREALDALVTHLLNVETMTGEEARDLIDGLHRESTVVLKVASG